MGSSNSHESSSNSKSRVSSRNQIKEQVTTKRIAQIQHLQNVQSNALTVINANETDQLLNQMLPDTLQIAEHQMKRKGSQLTKADLIAIIIAIEPNQGTRMYQLQTLNVYDLNFMIRSIIYNPDKYSTHVVPSAPPIVEATRLIEPYAELNNVEIDNVEIDNVKTEKTEY